jgi:hypothetical protein
MPCSGVHSLQFSLESATGAHAACRRVQLHDSTEQERRGLAMRRATRTLFPWTTENPLFIHMMNTTQAGMLQAVDDANSTGTHTHARTRAHTVAQRQERGGRAGGMVVAGAARP